MNVHTVVIDSRPSYLGGRGSGASLLLLPFGTGTLLEYVLWQLGRTASNPPLVLAPTGADEEYASAIQAASPRAVVVSTNAGFVNALASYEPSDVLLIVDPQCLPAVGLDLNALSRQHSADPRWAVHLVVFEKGIAGTKEYAQFDASGRMSRIQRYFDSVTWPFISGVAASLIPVSSSAIWTGLGRPPSSLWEWRRRLADYGVPGHDLGIEGGAHDLSDEPGMLAATEQIIIQTTSRYGQDVDKPLYVGSGHQIHPTAQIVGPVIIHGEVTVEREVRILGPALIGAKACVKTGAVVAQATVASGCVVPERHVVWHRAFYEGRPAEPLGDLPATSLRPLTAPPILEHSSGRSRRLASSLFAKRILDIVVAGAGLVILSPLLLAVAILIRLDSEGSVLYGHPREGRRARVFRCWKFRTMCEGADARQRELYAASAMDGPQFKLDNGSRGDPRVTRVGRLLRWANLDELPQLFNVVRGEMSLVGPRPSPFRENQVCVAWREARLSIRPGLTGLWQVCRHDRASGDFHQWIEYDLLYVQHMSLWLDVKIFAATILTLGGKRHVPLSWMISQRQASRRASRLSGDRVSA